MSARAAGELAPGGAVHVAASPDIPRLSWWRKRLFRLLLRLDAGPSFIEGLPRERVHPVDLPTRFEAAPAPRRTSLGAGH